MRVSEYIANRLAEFGVRHVFMLTGGGSMFLNYAIGKHPQIKTIFNHHEQASAMAAEGYARISGKPGVVNVTTGPGGVNALNGVYGAFTDSIPMLVISGQVKRETYIRTYDLPELRQLGDQEVDIVSMVKGITKYAVTVTDPQTIRHHLEKAWHLCQMGRPGPCWLDIPIDVQSSQINENELEGFASFLDPEPVSVHLKDSVSQTLTLLRSAKRPVILAGSGVRISNQVNEFLQIVHKLGIPVTTGWTHDIIDSDDPIFCGRPGTIGTRGGNFTVQNSDVLLILGSRLNIRQTGYAWKSFARAAYKIWVDVDGAELNRPTVKPDLAIQADLRDFFKELNRQLIDWDASPFFEWLSWCKERNRKYPAVSPKQREFNGKINPYYFIEALFENLDKDDIVVTGNASACIISFQTAKIKLGQRLFSNSGSASMGYDLPAAIGAAIAGGGRRVICLAGDGSLQLNIQELQTVAHYQLPIKLFVLNNSGYLSIRTSQKGFFGDVVGESAASGVSFPDTMKLAQAYGIPAWRLDSEDFSERIDEILAASGPVICEVVIDPAQGFEPRQASRQLPDGRIVSAPLEDMFPFLEREELRENLLIPEWEE
ncbi:MAG: acetolactate synthase [Anaerolineae bacterium UTCFX1]|jgi:acetolactate synthase-1/2/3 large subunit|nr:MAG: acetolactate synthase [Anaerolineae bacterium UTCFX1]